VHGGEKIRNLGVTPVSDVLMIVAVACFVDVFIIFVILSMLLYDWQGTIELRWPRSYQRWFTAYVRRSMQPSYVPSSSVLAHSAPPVGGESRWRDARAMWRPETSGFEWMRQMMHTKSETTSVAKVQINRRGTQLHWVVSNGRRRTRFVAPIGKQGQAPAVPLLAKGGGQ